MSAPPARIRAMPAPIHAVSLRTPPRTHTLAPVIVSAPRSKAKHVRVRQRLSPEARCQVAASCRQWQGPSITQQLSMSHGCLQTAEQLFLVLVRQLVHLPHVALHVCIYRSMRPQDLSVVQIHTDVWRKCTRTCGPPGTRSSHSTNKKRHAVQIKTCGVPGK